MPVVEQAAALHANASPQELALLSLAFAPEGGDANLRTLLSYLNGMTTHRFTGVYRFEPGWVMSVALWDRESPEQLLGADVKMKESYCWLTGLGKDSYIIEDACADARLDGHAAREQVRSYCAVMLRDRREAPWGTLCHFDFAPRKVDAETLSRLEAFRPLVEEILVRDCSAHWDPDAPGICAEVNY